MPSRRGTDYDRLLEGIRMEADGLPMRPVREWTPSKLALLSYYLGPFATLCSENAGGWYFLDGFAGNGANRAQGMGAFKGSALIGAMTEPHARQAVLIEKNARDARNLRKRIGRIRPDAPIIQGDCNERIGDALEHFDNRRLPAFCMLDPEGMELYWDTIEACFDHRQHSTPYELLIYFSTPGAMRVGAVTHPRLIEGDERALRRLFGNDDWLPIAEKQRDSMLDAGKAQSAYLDLYMRQLRQLGYRHVMPRPALRDGSHLVYHLVFASSNDTARKIMESALGRAYVGQLPMQF